MAGNLKLSLTVSISAIDAVSNAAVASVGPSTFTLSATTHFFDDYFQAATVATTVPLPATTVYSFLIINQGTNNVTVSFTPTGGTAETIVVQPGGMLCSWEIAEAAGGITALSLTATTATTPCLVFLGA